MFAPRVKTAEAQVECGCVRRDGVLLTGRMIGAPLDRAETDLSTYEWRLAALG